MKSVLTYIIPFVWIFFIVSDSFVVHPEGLSLKIRWKAMELIPDSESQRINLSGNLAPTGLLCELLSNPELSFITNRNPKFGWIVPAEKQSAYQIIVASSEELLNDHTGDFWDSGKITSNQSIQVGYEGKPLQSNASYWWKVKVWDGTGKPTLWSKNQRFNTSDFTMERSWPGESKLFECTGSNGEIFWTFENRHPIRFHSITPKRHVARDTVDFYDFGKSAFAYLKMNITYNGKSTDTSKIVINTGEKARDNIIDKNPGGGIIFRQYPLTLKGGTHNYVLEIPRFIPLYPHSQSLPSNMPEVIPFRYCEIHHDSNEIIINDIAQQALFYDHNPEASYFLSSNENLNLIYDLCKYSTLANTFNGDYANSERERMMYEADCYIQQICHYSVDREFAIQRYSTQNLFYHATWPTEWIMHSVFMAYADYMHTGNCDLIERNYEVLKSKTLMALTTENGLISTKTGLQTDDFLNSIHFNGQHISDIVDWPHGTSGLHAQGLGEGGETDNFEFTTFNPVVNAFHYRCLILMADMARAIGNKDDAGFFELRAENFRKIFNDNFLSSDGIYVDGIGSNHASVHANLFPLAFGLVPEKNIPQIVGFIKSKGMAVGVYAANYLLEALYLVGEDDYALELLTSETDRSWMNMIKTGSTMTTEAWDIRYMPQFMGWSHAWSASPAHIISRKLMGIEPLEAGFGKISVKPQPGSLTFAKIKLSTIRGDIFVDFDQQEGKYLNLNISLPGNTVGKVFIPVISDDYLLMMDGKEMTARHVGNYCTIDHVKPGNHSFSMINKNEHKGCP